MKNQRKHVNRSINGSMTLNNVKFMSHKYASDYCLWKFVYYVGIDRFSCIYYFRIVRPK